MIHVIAMSPRIKPAISVFVFSALEELHSIIQEVKYRTGLQSAKLLRQLRRRDRLNHKVQKNYDIITACLQAVSQKRRKNTHLSSSCFNTNKDWSCCVLTFRKRPRHWSALRGWELRRHVLKVKNKSLPVLYTHYVCPSTPITCSMEMGPTFT